MSDPAPNVSVRIWNHDIEPDQGCQFAFTTCPDETTIIVICQTCGNLPLAKIGLAKSEDHPPNVWSELPLSHYPEGSPDPEPAIAQVCIRHLEDVARTKQARRQVLQFLGMNQPRGDASAQLPKATHKALAKAADRVKSQTAAWRADH